MHFRKNLFAFCLLASVSCHAQETAGNSGWYIGGAIGSSKTELEFSDFSDDENAIIHQVYGGYNFNQWFGIESHFFISDDVSSDAGIRDAYFSGISIAPKINLQVSPQLAFFAKAGLAQVGYTEEYSRRYYEDNYEDDYRFDRRQNWNDQTTFFSAGAEWSINNQLKLRLVYDHISGSVEEDDYDDYDGYSPYYVDEIDITLKTVSCGVHYQF